MAEREQVRRSVPRETESPAPVGATGESATELKAELDDLLDEIDDVLETNAEEFVKNYVQKGGE